MKATTVALFAAGAQAFDWSAWNIFDSDTTVTETQTNYHTYCPCEASAVTKTVNPVEVSAGGWYGQPTTVTVCPNDGECYVSTKTHTVEATVYQTVCPQNGACYGTTLTVAGSAVPTAVDPTYTSTVCPYDGQCYVTTVMHTAAATVTQTVCPNNGACYTNTNTYTPSNTWTYGAVLTSTVCPLQGSCYVTSITNTVQATATTWVTPSNGGSAVGPILTGTTSSTTSSSTTSSTTDAGSAVGPILTGTTSSTTTSTTTMSTSSSSTTTDAGSAVGPILTGTTSSTTTSTTTDAGMSTSSMTTTSTTTDNSLATSVLTSESSTTISTSLDVPIATSSAGTSSISTAATTDAPVSTSTASTVAPLSSTTTTTAAAGSQTIYVSVAGMDYQTAMLAQHNVHRQNHTNTPDLVWDAALANTAQEIASSCVYAHNTTADGGGYGQNIGAGSTPAQAPGLITNGMYNNEMPNYPGPYGSDNVDTSNFAAWGHFSQIVWAATTSVGCYTQYCPNGLANTGAGIPPYFTVCNYKPAGNYVGQWSNIHAPLGGPTVVVLNS